MWMVRAGRGSEIVEEFLTHGIAALGGTKLGKLRATMKKDELLRLYAEKYPEESEQSRASWASQLLRFMTEIKAGDTVVTFDRGRRLYFLGIVSGEYEWAPKLIKEEPHIRRVKWTHQTPRDPLSVETRNTLGATQALFKLGLDVANDLHDHQVPIGSKVEDESDVEDTTVADESAEAQVRSEVLERADEFIEDAISRLDWEQMQELVAGILRSMGYRTTISPKPTDRGKDIFASPDGLGLEEPRIFVEVKHRTGTPIGADKIRGFLGGRKPGEKCLYVSTGSFTKEARYEAERASVPTTLIDLQVLRKLLVENYEKLDAETRALVPLKRFYWPLR